MRLPTYKELKRYVEVEGWEDKDKKSSKKKSDHHRYVFTTPTGARLYTRVSHGNEQIYDQEFFGRILRDQLCIDEAQFWAAVDKGVKPRRPMPVSASQQEGIDAKLARNLIAKVGLGPSDLVDMSQEDAVRIWQEWLGSGRT
ncbi:MAG: hypothetical protein HY050_02615 [Actinobacteria bacterium]|nr:hypothetical protein [Actinomycetota bacterium]